MQFLSNDSDIFFAPPLFFILPFLRFHYLSWCVFHAIIKITFGMVISKLLRSKLFVFLHIIAWTIRVD